MLRMKDERAPKKSLKVYTEGRRSLGRPRRRWMDAVDRDAQMLGGGGLKRLRPRVGCSATGGGGGGEELKANQNSDC